MRQAGGTGWLVGRWKVIVTPSTEALNFKEKKGERKGGGGCGEHQRSRVKGTL